MIVNGQGTVYSSH